MKYLFYDYNSLYIVWFHLLWFYLRRTVYQLRSLLIRITGISELSKAIRIFNKQIGRKSSYKDILMRGGGQHYWGNQFKEDPRWILKECVFLFKSRFCLCRDFVLVEILSMSRFCLSRFCLVEIFSCRDFLLSRLCLCRDFVCRGFVCWGSVPVPKNHIQLIPQIRISL